MRLQALALVAIVGACDDPARLPSEPIFEGRSWIHHVSLISVAYANDPLVEKEQAFDRWVIGSKWLATVGAPYDIQGFAYLGGYVIPHDAPPSIAWDDLTHDIAAAVPYDPKATFDGDRPIYMVRLPYGAKLSDATCTEYGAMHSVTGDGRVLAVMPDCFDDGTLTGYSSSHELIEAATDPEPQWGAGWMGQGLFDRQEVADMCEWMPAVEEDGYLLTRSWSISDPIPCVPAPAGEAYVNVEVERLPSGDVRLTGWSSMPTGDWPLEISNAWPDSHAKVTASSTTIGVGKHVVLHADLPPDEASAVFEIRSRGARARVSFDSTIPR